MSLEELSGRNAIVTGAAGGIGAEIARVFAQHGIHVALIDCNQKKLLEAESEIKRNGGTTHSIIADLKDPKAIKNAIDALANYSKNWDILVNNAGIVKRGPLLDFSCEDWDELLQVNLRSTFLLSRAIARNMIEQKRGKIINISSNATFYGTPGSGPYAVSKAGINQLTKTMALEWGPHNIQVNAICPSIVMTELGSRIWDAPENQKTKEKLISKIPLRRFVELKEITPLVLFLAGSGSNFINGEIIGIDDGARYNPI